MNHCAPNIVIVIANQLHEPSFTMADYQDTFVRTCLYPNFTAKHYLSTKSFNSVWNESRLVRKNEIGFGDVKEV
jgi:hypothetical protein